MYSDNVNQEEWKILSSTPDPSVEGCIVALKRCRAIMDALTPEQYRFAPPGHGSLGEHVRHTVDHFQCFLRGLEMGEIDYDTRERNPALEANPEVAGRAMDDLLDALAEVDLPPDQPVSVIETVAPGHGPRRSRSTVGRELSFLSGHTIHHVALMRLIAHRAGAQPINESDLAFSTENYRSASVDQS